MKMDWNKTNLISEIGQDVLAVSMGSSEITSDKNTVIGTFGLGPCVGVAISVKDSDEKIHRFVAHIDMGQIIGMRIDEHLSKMKNFIANIIGAHDINVGLASTQSFINPNNLNENELRILGAIKELNPTNYSITNASVIEVKPDGDIICPRKEQIEQQKYKMLIDVAKANGCKIDYSLRVPYVVDEQKGCFIQSLISLDEFTKMTEEDRDKYIEGRLLYYQEEFKNYKAKFVMGTSAIDSDSLGIYMENYKEVAEKNYGYVPFGMKVGEKTREIGFGRDVFLGGLEF